MTVYYAIVEGDPLDNGSDSRVIGGSDHSTIEDQHGRLRRQTHLGQEAWCGVCKSFGPILADAGIKESLRGWDERLNAFEAVSGDIVLCKCERHPRVVAVYARSCTYEDYEGGGLAVTASTRSTSAQCATYDEQFTLRDSEGRVLAEMYYTVCLANGNLVHGTTDRAGRTNRHETNDAQTVRIYLGHREEN
ncbi:hypothetical protein [Paraburkholderia tagetis]|uniref:PAAR motif-containing protein n=1 Tax=Paraburkholderia tagetis TaxID=2913261 RepID=A0A9X1RSU6_9BURK|nr:hypothetical protein [Paraburkholderia tagetis]MCG5075212.1 hypothetical protein [Paraburkholderia tagetis]